MKAENIRIELIEWLTKLDDINLLTSILQFKKSNESGDWAENLNAAQIESLQRGLADMKKGDLIDSKTFWASYGRKI